MLTQKTINSYTLPKKKLQSLENGYIPWEAESQQSVRKVSVLTCLTMYNEDGVEFIRSIAGLARNIENCNDAEEDRSPDKFTICVIADGRERIHPTTLYWAKRLGLLPEESLKTSNSSLACSDQLSIYETIVSTREVAMVATEVAQKHNLSITELLRQEDLPRKEKYSDRDYSRQDCYFKIIFCIKEENAGKLDSHWWFLNHICPVVEPKYFIQTDVGTVAGDRTMYRLRQTLEHDSNCAAANACILTSPPSNPLKALHAWQYATFVWDKTMDWSMQALGGYVDVIPGQLAMFRWVALSDTPTVTEPKNHSPLERYFRGLQQLPPLESNLFLAEDRVLGFEILTNPQKNWTIRYVPDAIAITDECKSLGELLRQRRRWINSGNIATLYHAVHYILDNNNSKQLNVLGVMGWKITSALAIWFIPLLMFGPLLLTGIHSQTIFTDNPMLSQAIPIAVSAFVISWLMQLLLCIKNQPTKKWVNVWLHLTLSLQALILFVVNGVMLFRDPSMTILFSLIVGVPLICPLITARKISKSLFKRMIPLALGYVFGGFVVYLLLTTNAIVNLNDCSWGTKGLHNEEKSTGRRFPPKEHWILSAGKVFLYLLVFGLSIGSLLLMDKISVAHLLVGFSSVIVSLFSFQYLGVFKPRSRRAKFNRFRNTVLIAWILSNGSLILALTQSGSQFGWQVSGAVYFFLSLKIAVEGVCGLIQYLQEEKLAKTYKAIALK